MVWFKVDDKFHEHSKPNRAGLEAIGLWTMCGSLCGDNENDGFVPERVLIRWVSTRPRAKKLAKTLVDVGLWKPGTHDGEDGWWFHDWPEFQPTKAEIAEKRRQKAEAGRKGGLKSGESRREAGAKAGASAVVEPDANPEPDPTPSPLSVVTNSGLSSLHAAGMTDDALLKVALATGGDMGHAAKVARNVLSSASGDVRRPLQYVLAAVKDRPEEHRFRRGNPRRDQECKDHPGEWADYCRIHMSEGSA